MGNYKCTAPQRYSSYMQQLSIVRLSPSKLINSETVLAPISELQYDVKRVSTKLSICKSDKKKKYQMKVTRAFNNSYFPFHFSY